MERPEGDIGFIDGVELAQYTVIVRLRSMMDNLTEIVTIDPVDKTSGDERIRLEIYNFYKKDRDDMLAGLKLLCEEERTLAELCVYIEECQRAVDDRMQQHFSVGQIKGYDPVHKVIDMTSPRFFAFRTVNGIRIEIRFNEETGWHGFLLPQIRARAEVPQPFIHIGPDETSARRVFEYAVSIAPAVRSAPELWKAVKAFLDNGFRGPKELTSS